MQVKPLVKNLLRFTNSSQIYLLGALLIAFLFAFLASISLGSFNFSVFELFNSSKTSLHTTVLYEIRIPRVILAAFVGASLGLSGASLQGLFRNPLADPGLIGVSAGAALGASIIIVFGSTIFSKFLLSTFLLPIAACIGSGVVIFLLFLLTKGFGHQGVTYMLLVGIAINAIASVGIGILTFISTDSELRGLTFWTMGSFGGITWPLFCLLYTSPSPRD